MSELPPNPGPDPSQPPPYGATPPPPPPYGAPPPPPPLPPEGGGPYFSATAAIGYGWGAFKANVGPFLGLTVLMLVVAGVFSSIADSSDGRVAKVIMQLIGQAVSYLFGAALMKGAIDAVSGRSVSFGSMWADWNKLQVLVAAVLLAVGTTVGLLLCILPGLAFALFTAFTMYFIIDQGKDAVAAIGSSMTLVGGHLGGTILLALISIGVALLGIIALLVGILVAIPVIYVAGAYAYRVFQGQPVAVQA